MIDPETVSESFIAWLESQGIATFKEDLFLSQVPDSAPDNCYWITTSGGGTILRLSTGEKVKQYFVSVYFRSNKGQTIEKNMFKLEELIDTPGCLNLEPFVLYDEVDVNQYPTDNDFDSEDRRVGMLQANIKIYKKEQ